MSLKLDLTLDHGKLSVELPTGHHITVPASADGMQQLVHLLREQRKAQETLNAKHESEFATVALAQAAHWKCFGIGTRPSPTQQEVDHNRLHAAKKRHDPNCVFCRLAATPVARELRAEDLFD